MDDIFNINPKVSTAICVLIGYLIIEDFNANEQNVIGNWLMLISQLVITNAVSQSIIEQRCNGNILNLNSKEVKEEYNPFCYDIDRLKSILKDIKEEDINTFFNGVKKGINSFENMYKDYFN